MIRGGKVCEHCTADRCHDKPGEADPLEIVCPQCDEAGCESCNHTGWIQIKGCPQRWIDHDVHRLIRFAELFRKGIPPVSGGALDQTHSFMQAEGFYRAEMDQWRGGGLLDEMTNDG